MVATSNMFQLFDEKNKFPNFLVPLVVALIIPCTTRSKKSVMSTPRGACPACIPPCNPSEAYADRSAPPSV
jgi:hypothetical protein